MRAGFKLVVNCSMKIVKRDIKGKHEYNKLIKRNVQKNNNTKGRGLCPLSLKYLSLHPTPQVIPGGPDPPFYITIVKNERKWEILGSGPHPFFHRYCNKQMKRKKKLKEKMDC